MALAIPNGFGSAVLHWNYIPLGREITVTHGYEDSLGSDDPNDAAAEIRGACVAVGSIANAAQMSTQYQFLGVTTLQRTSAGQLMAGASLVTTTGTQTAPTNAVPVFNSLVVTKRTPLAGIRFRGRMYPPMTTNGEENVDAGGTILPATVSALQVFWNNFFSAFFLTNYPPFLLHEATGVVPLPTPVTSFFLRPVVGMQRRRRSRGA